MTFMQLMPCYTHTEQSKHLVVSGYSCALLHTLVYLCILLCTLLLCSDADYRRISEQIQQKKRKKPPPPPPQSNVRDSNLWDMSGYFWDVSGYFGDIDWQWLSYTTNYWKLQINALAKYHVLHMCMKARAHYCYTML